MPQWQKKATHHYGCQEHGYPVHFREAYLFIGSRMLRVLNHIASVPFTSSDESDPTFVDSGTYCRLSNSGSHVTSKLRHVKQITQQVRARNRKLEAAFAKESDHQRQMQHPASRHSSPPLKNPGAQEKLSTNNNSRCLYTRYP